VETVCPVLKKTPATEIAPANADARDELVRVIKRACKRLGLDAKDPALWEYLRTGALEDNQRKRGPGREKEWRRFNLMMLGMHWYGVTHGRPPMTRREAVALILKTFPEAYNHPCAPKFNNERALVRRLPRAIKIAEHQVLFWQRHPRLRERVDARLDREERRRATK
jgi:hypothetical protein